jgi:Tol biopolymer transport system component
MRHLLRCGCLFCLLLIAGSWGGAPATQAAAAVQPEAEKIWADSTTDGTGHISPDGRLLSFGNWATGDLAIRDLKSSGNRLLTNESVGDSGQYSGRSVISPDGQQIAYNWSKAGFLEVRVIPVTGGSPRVIDTGREFTSWVQAWTPDGRKLVIIRGQSLEKTQDIGLLDIESGQFRRVGHTEPGASASLSSDGSRLVLSELSKQDPTQRDIRMIDLITGHARSLVTGRSDDYAPDWAPDGKSIYFLSDRNARARLWRLPLSDRAASPHPLHDIPDGDARIIGVTRDGTVFVGAYDIGGTNCFIARADWRTGEVAGVRQIVNPPLRGARRAVFSPDGTRVAFLRRRRGFGVRPGWQIPVVQFVDGSGEREYPTALTIRDEAAWYADGRALLFTMPPEGAVGESAARTWRFIRLDLTTGRYSDVAETGAVGQVRVAGFTNQEVFYLLNDFNARIGYVMALDLRTGAKRELYRIAGGLPDAAVTDNGARIAIAARPDGKRGVSVILPSSKEPAPIAEMQTGARQLMWFPGGDSVLASGRIEDRVGIWRLYVNGDPPVRLKLDANDVTEIRVSSDGQRIAYTRTAQAFREVWSFRTAKQPEVGR